MKDKTQKSFRGIVRILLLVFCYTFGSHAFALALEHEQTVDIYKVTDVPIQASTRQKRGNVNVSFCID